MKQKLCYVLPRYEVTDASHFSHIHDFLKKIEDSFDLFLIVERGEEPGRELLYNRVFVGRGPFRLFSIGEALIQARLAGCRDFYIHYSFFSAFLASLIVGVFGGRVLYWNCGEPWKYKRNFLREMFERLVYKMVTHLVTGAPSLADVYAQQYGIRRPSILIMPNWIDRERFRSLLSREEARAVLRTPQDASVVLFVHRLSPRKGSRMIIPIASEVIRTHPHTVFVVVGSGPDEDFLHNEIQKKRLGENIRLVGAVANRELPDYFAAADVFLMPSEEEGFPRVLLESMNTSVPFAASDVGAVTDIVPECMRESVVRAGDVRGFVDRVSALLNKSNQERIVMEKELKSWVTRYDIVTVVDTFKKLFQSI